MQKPAGRCPLGHVHLAPVIAGACASFCFLALAGYESLQQEGVTKGAWECRMDGMDRADGSNGVVAQREEPDLMAQAAAGHDDLMTGKAPVRAPFLPPSSRRLVQNCVACRTQYSLVACSACLQVLQQLLG